MATYNVDAYPSALVSTRTKRGTAERSDFCYDLKQISGLAVGDNILIDLPVPAFARSVVFMKRTDTSNADTLQVFMVSPALPSPPILTTPSGAPASSATASSATALRAFLMGDTVRFQLTIAGTVPTALAACVSFLDF